MIKHTFGIPSARGRHPGGRPPIQLKPEWCMQLVDHMSRGNSFESFASVISVAKQTLYTLTKRHPEFLDARERGKMACLYWFEMVGICGMLGIKKAKMIGPNNEVTEIELGRFQPSIWRLNMICRFRDEWKSYSKPNPIGGEEIENLRDRIEALSKLEKSIG